MDASRGRDLDKFVATGFKAMLDTINNMQRHIVNKFAYSYHKIYHEMFEMYADSDHVFFAIYSLIMSKKL